MTWNYRVVRKRHESEGEEKRIMYSYSIHEVFYDENGKMSMMTQNPVEVFGETVFEVIKEYLRMSEAFLKPIVDYDSIPEEGETLTAFFEERKKEIDEGNFITHEELMNKFKEDWGYKGFDEDKYWNDIENKRIAAEKRYETYIKNPFVFINRLIRMMKI